MAENKATIVVKRVKKGRGGHHGGAWKIAYADFVTAMMAFFLLMWLLSSTSKSKLEGIAEYFKTPMKVAMQGGSSVSERSSVIKGGGKDVTKKEGEVRKVMDLSDAQKEIEKREKAQLEALKKKIEAAIDANPMLRQFKKQLLLDITSEGLRIQIVDEKNRPMFALASATLQPYTRDILREIGRMLNDVPNRIGLSTPIEVCCSVSRRNSASTCSSSSLCTDFIVDIAAPSCCTSRGDRNFITSAASSSPSASISTAALCTPVSIIPHLPSF